MTARNYVTPRIPLTGGSQVTYKKIGLIIRAMWKSTTQTTIFIKNRKTDVFRIFKKCPLRKIILLNARF